VGQTDAGAADLDTAVGDSMIEWIENQTARMIGARLLEVE
jgi:hypothetical protein